jgi:hypothetical protein
VARRSGEVAVHFLFDKKIIAALSYV